MIGDRVILRVSEGYTSRSRFRASEAMAHSARVFPLFEVKLACLPGQIRKGRERENCPATDELVVVEVEERSISRSKTACRTCCVMQIVSLHCSYYKISAPSVSARKVKLVKWVPSRNRSRVL